MEAFFEVRRSDRPKIVHDIADIPSGESSLAAGWHAETMRQFERLHRRYLDVVQSILNDRGIDDVNPVQALMVADIGDGEVALRELIDRGYYLANAATYNIRKLAELGYVEQGRSARDRRVGKVKLTAKGMALRLHLLEADGEISEAFDQFDNWSARLQTVSDTVRDLERVYLDRISRRPY